jgi:hypothetical protein
MSPRIASAVARDDFSVEIRWVDGGVDRVDFKPIIARGGVMEALGDAKFFVSELRVEPDGYGLGWATKPARPGEVGGIDFSAQGLWYQAHPEKLAEDQVNAAE